ncbi:hypothetical protein [Fimbriiglobus ruber]|uniref:hypothetical protein n=1 Tax=Fimbriiglobus ruber TaxID=1908690 RepID=UPI001379FEF1|nr:hypothetical protein [Fimbriiglobus ruber]
MTAATCPVPREPATEPAVRGFLSDPHNAPHPQASADGLHLLVPEPLPVEIATHDN